MLLHVSLAPLVLYGMIVTDVLLSREVYSDAQLGLCFFRVRKAWKERCWEKAVTPKKTRTKRKSGAKGVNPRAAASTSKATAAVAKKKWNPRQQVYHSIMQELADIVYMGRCSTRESTVRAAKENSDTRAVR